MKHLSTFLLSTVLTMGVAMTASAVEYKTIQPEKSKVTFQYKQMGGRYCIHARVVAFGLEGAQSATGVPQHHVTADAATRAFGPCGYIWVDDCHSSVWLVAELGKRCANRLVWRVAVARLVRERQRAGPLVARGA